ncbi:MAG TPA: hypothetical protein VIA61_07860 [Methylomirabilota bacterium]|jgi:hypothetical protein
MSAVYTLEQILDRLDELSLDGQAFCRSLLSHGEVLAVQLSYLPESLLWLVTSPTQTRIMRAHQPDCIILTLGEARDLFTTLGDPCPATLMEVAGRFATAAPGTPEGKDDEDAEPYQGRDEDEGDYV